MTQRLEREKASQSGFGIVLLMNVIIVVEEQMVRDCVELCVLRYMREIMGKEEEIFNTSICFSSCETVCYLADRMNRASEPVRVRCQS